MTQVVLAEDRSYLTLCSEGKTARFHALWLRDNAMDATTRAPLNGQKLISVTDIPRDISISDARISGNALQVTFGPGDEVIEFSIDWLLEHAYDKSLPACAGWTAASIETWDGSLQARIPVCDFRDAQSDPASLHAWLSGVACYGFGKLENGPVEDEALMNVVSLFGFVRETNYGRHFEVRTEINATNLAFTEMGLPAHTDNPYRDPVPTIQVLYCLESSAPGGENKVVDGFRAIQRLHEEKPDWFDVLSMYCARFEYAGEEGVVLRSRRPVIELAPDGELIGIRFNNRSSAAITDVPFDQMETYYHAYRRLAEIVNEPVMQVSFRLEPGECFVVDNTRVLHARTAYAGTGKRWLQGCYADKDGLLSRLASLEKQVRRAA